MPVSQSLPAGPFTPGAGTPGPDVSAVVAFLREKGTATDTELLPKSGGTMTGALVLSGDPTSPLNPATKKYTDAVGLSFPLASVVAGVAPGGVDGDKDHTAAVQAYVNQVSTQVKQMGLLVVAEIVTPAQTYRVQNLTLPGNVRLVGPAKFKYVGAALNPPSGPGNYVVRCYGRYGGVEGIEISGNGAAQDGIGGVWLMPPGAASPTSERSFQSVVNDVMFDQLSGRAVYDQGVGNHIQVRLAQNCLLGTSLRWFQGVVEQAGTDGWFGDSEVGPSVVAVSNGIPVPRRPAQLDAVAVGTTTAAITLPLVNATVTLSAASPATTGGAYLLDGHLVTFTGVSGDSLTGAYCADTGTIPTGTNAYPATGYVAGFMAGGSNNWARDSVVEFADVGIVLGNSVKAHSVGEVTLSQTPTVLPLDSALHLAVTGTIVGVPTVGTTVTFPLVTYTSISQATLGTAVTLSATAQSMQVDSTTGWPASGTLSASGRLITYTSIVDGTTIGGCTVTGGSVALAAGAYLRANALNGCTVASGTLLVAGRAITEISGGSRVKWRGLRSDFSRTHGLVITNGGGEAVDCGAIGGPNTSTATYDAFHVCNSGAAELRAVMPWASNTASRAANRYKYAINDLNASGAAWCEWLFPIPGNALTPYFAQSLAGGHFTLAGGPGLQVAVNSASPSVANLTHAVDANTVATTLLNFTLGVNGQELWYQQGVNTTVANGSGIVTKSGASIPPPATGYALLHFKRMGYGSSPLQAWYQA